MVFVVRGANGATVWAFKPNEKRTKTAHCANDGFTIEYTTAPQSQVSAVVQMVQHSISLNGAFQSAFSVDL